MARRFSRARKGYREYPQGVLSVHAGGYGFVKTARGEYFIPESKMNGAFDGDLVEVSALPVRRGKSSAPHSEHHETESPAARVVRVIERAHVSVVGRFEAAEPFGVVIPLDYRIRYDIFTRLADAPHIPDGSLVRVRVLTFPSKREAATGIIEEVLDTQEASFASIDALIDRHHLETRFSDASLEQLAGVSVDEEQALRDAYADVRNRLVVTIDPSDAKDFDDALSLVPAAEIPEHELPDAAKTAALAWRLGVHIADVSSYVAWDSSVDLDARRRACSVYLVDRVIPMLPEVLSNDVCSLKPNETRRCITVDMYLDKQANVLATRIYPALMRSAARLTYDEVQACIEDAQLGKVYAFAGLAADANEQVQHLVLALHQVSEKLFALKKRRGLAPFETIEAKLRLDEQSVPREVVLRRKTQATQLVEEAMILANEAVAQYLVDQGIPGIFRVHEAPLSDDLAELVPQFEEFSWWQKIDRKRFIAADHYQIQKVVDCASGRPEAYLVNQLLLRAMTRAVYKPLVDEHFGLASKAYVHFTSPIRRYPDLVVHRMLKYYWHEEQGKMGKGELARLKKEVKQLSWIAEHSSKMERVAAQAESESNEFKLVEYMQQFEGEQFDALISGVARYGIYVKLENTAEGLIPVRTLGSEYFSYDRQKHALVGEDSGVTYRLGMRLRVRLRAADPKTRSLDFRLV